MITESNFRDVLARLGFTSDTYEIAYENETLSMRVDFTARKLFYPQAIQGRERNDNFSVPENFVVFECVARLLEKGYSPEDIELERQWLLGHESKGGRADICVSDSNGNTLFIIECKTWGREFDKALSDTKDDGAQLFSYW